MKKIRNIIKSLPAMILIIIATGSKAQTQSVIRDAGAEKKVAILPITFVGEGGMAKLDEMRYRLQNIAYLYLKKEAVELKFQDPAETNALLLKKGINASNFREFTVKELAEILKVEYVLTGMVMQETTGTATTRNSNRQEYERRNKSSREIHERTKTTEELNTDIDLSLYNDKGEQLYSKSRRSILYDVDAYKNGMHYLLKRCPLYKR